jgi:hypothetical protein
MISGYWKLKSPNGGRERHSASGMRQLPGMRFGAELAVMYRPVDVLTPGRSLGIKIKIKIKIETKIWNGVRGDTEG